MANKQKKKMLKRAVHKCNVSCSDGMGGCKKDGMGGIYDMYPDLASKADLQSPVSSRWQGWLDKWRNIGKFPWKPGNPVKPQPGGPWKPMPIKPQPIGPYPIKPQPGGPWNPIKPLPGGPHPMPVEPKPVTPPGDIGRYPQPFPPDRFIGLPFDPIKVDPGQYTFFKDQGKTKKPM